MATQPEPGKAVQYWVTRDSGPDGALSSIVDVWLQKPTRTFYGWAGVMWMVEPWDLGQRYDQFDIRNLPWWLPTIPDDDRMVVVYD